jgi:hypothetical protein
MITKTDATRTIGPKVISTPRVPRGTPAGHRFTLDGPAPLREPNRRLHPDTRTQLEVNPLRPVTDVVWRHRDFVRAWVDARSKPAESRRVAEAAIRAGLGVEPE